MASGRRSVGCGFGHRIGAGIATSARLVLDNECLLGLLFELIGDQASHEVGR
jgi:hypothetical protein